MIILLDIDGVLVTSPGWRHPERLADNFMKFNEEAANNLAKLYLATNASIVLTSTHRISYPIETWYDIFKARGLHFTNISKVNDKNTFESLLDRGTEVKEWVDNYGQESNYVVIDDDLSLHDLPLEIKQRCVITKPLIGFDSSSLEKALRILNL